MAGIMLAWMLDSLLLPLVEVRLANIFTGFVCGVEFWSYLENASVVTNEKSFSEAIVALKQRLLRALGMGDGAKK